MGYLDDLLEYEKQIRKNFKVIKRTDLSDIERRIYDEVEVKLNGTNPDVYAASLREKLRELEEERKNPIKAFEELLEKNDPTALQIQNTYTGYVNERERIRGNKANLEKQIEALKNEYVTLKKNEDKALEVYNNKVIEINKSYDASASKVEKSEFKRVNKFSDELKKKNPEFIKLHEELEELDSYLQQAESQLAIFYQYVETVPEKSNEYKEYNKAINDIVDKRNRFRREAAPKRARYIELKSKIPELNKEIADDRKYQDKLNDLNAKKEADLAKALEKYNAVKALTTNNNNQTDKLYAELHVVDESLRVANENVDNTQKIKFQLAAGKIDEKINDVKHDEVMLGNYKLIDLALKNDKPEIDGSSFARSLAEVKKAYMSYHERFSATQRFFRWVPFTKVRSEYKAFTAFKNRFLNLTHTSKAEVNKYLDENLITGELKAKMGEYSIKTNNLEYKVNPDFTKKEGISDNSYIDRMVELGNNLFSEKNSIGEMTAKVEVMLSMYAALKTVKASAKLNDALSLFENKIMSYSKVTPYRDMINDMILNAKLGDNSKEFPEHTQEETVKEYKEFKNMLAKSKENENNMVIYSYVKGLKPLFNNNDFIEREAPKLDIVDENLRKNINLEENVKNDEADVKENDIAMEEKKVTNSKNIEDELANNDIENFIQ